MIKPRFEYKDCLLFLSIATIPLQTLAIPARSTLVDISCILIASYFILYLPKKFTKTGIPLRKSSKAKYWM